MRTLQPLCFVLIGLAGLGSVAWGQSTQPCCNQNNPERRTIAVNGTAQVTADADLAVVRVGYKLFGPDAKSAYDSATQASNAIMDALTASGISKSAVESTSQVLEHTAQYDLNQFPIHDEERTRRQFTVTQNWIIRVKPDQAGAALNIAVGAGANESGWIQWAVEDPGALEARAASEAVANARKIAEEIAVKSGVRLGRLMDVSENQGPVQYNGALGMAMGGSVFGMGDAVMLAGVAPGANQQLAINSRRVEFRATVRVVFAIEDTSADAK
ncbi:MAG: SIMPL domain-containing protein [Terracidiphilus sp.]